MLDMVRSTGSRTLNMIPYITFGCCLATLAGGLLAGASQWPGDIVAHLNRRIAQIEQGGSKQANLQRLWARNILPLASGNGRNMVGCIQDHINICASVA